MRTLFLTLEMYRQTGGIQNVSQLLSQVLTELSKEDPAKKSCSKTYSLYDKSYRMTSLYKYQLPYQKGFKGNIMAFLYNCICAGYKSDVILLNHINLLPVGILLALFKPRLKIVILAHGIEIWRKIAFWKKVFLVKKATVWAVSTFTVNHIRKNIDERIQVQILNNALPVDFMVPCEFKKPAKLLKKHALQKDQPILLSVCRMTRHEQDKGIGQVIKAIPALLTSFPTLKYIVAGETDEQEKRRLMNLVKHYNIPQHVEFTGFISQKQLSNYYLLSDIFIMPSKKEGFGLAFIEAAACGLRIIAGNQDGSRDALLNGQLGTLVDPENVLGLQQAITQILGQPWSKQQAASIQKICLQHFSHQAYKENVKKLLHRIFCN